VAIESQTGLTDRWIAHQPIARRGRIGHEKAAPLDYLIDRREVHFTIHHFAGAALDLDSAIPMVPIVFDTVPGRIVCWDPAVLDELRRRGARFVDFPAWLDQYAPTLDSLRDDQAAQAYQRIRRLYFEHVRDPRREALFLARLSRGRESGR
jgi:hypothetical protein